MLTSRGSTNGGKEEEEQWWWWCGSKSFRLEEENENDDRERERARVRGWWWRMNHLCLERWINEGGNMEWISRAFEMYLIGPLLKWQLNIVYRLCFLLKHTIPFCYVSACDLLKSWVSRHANVVTRCHWTIGLLDTKLHEAFINESFLYVVHS